MLGEAIVNGTTTMTMTTMITSQYIENTIRVH